jgi:hypothetical protein
MLCRFCGVTFDDEAQFARLWSNTEFSVYTVVARWECPGCRNWMIELTREHDGALEMLALSRGADLSRADRAEIDKGSTIVKESGRLIYPIGASRRVPPEVEATDQLLASDYREACAVIDLSAKAAAALARRCLQHVIRSQLDIKERTLDVEIKKVVDAGRLSSAVLGQLDVVRNFGNVAAHPMQNEHVGEIVDVDPGEAEWTLDVLDQLFDEVYVAPVMRYERTVAANLKLASVGKPTMPLPPLPKGYDPSPKGSSIDEPM